MKKPSLTYSRILISLRRLLRNDHMVLSALGLTVGALTGAAVVGFRELISTIQLALFHSGSERLFQHAQELPWWQIILVPAGAGLVVGLFIYHFMPNRRPQGVADVIEANALRGARMSAKAGFGAALASAISIGAGASVGREGPAVHIGATLGAWISQRLHLTRSLRRTLLGCGVGAAVAASFNAPIAGALFASEVVVGHYALKAFAPIVIASVASTALSRTFFGDFPAFALESKIIASFWEFPAFVLLGIVAGVASIVFMRSIFLAQDLADKTKLPIWIRPMFAGLLVGLIALFYPQVLGVGYGTTESALLLQFGFYTMVVIGLAKIAATAACIGWGFGGGVFSPSLVIGAMVGGSFGIVATHFFPELSSGPGAYTIVGMGAVAAAVMGAPISTTLIIFEMTSNYALTLGVMLAVVASSEITHHFFGRSFFNNQLKRRGIDVKEGFETEIMKSIRISEVYSNDGESIQMSECLQDLRIKLQKSPLGEIFVLRDSGQLYGTVTFADLSESAFDHGFDDLITASDVARLHPPVLTVADDLETALSVMRDSGEEHIAVVDDTASMTFKGCVHHREVMAAYNKLLLQTRHEEHGE
ncbi:MAG: chloride channel protein [Rhodospirillales bacterium]|nr:chloride channel protein [Rhodospirillales bacterium]